jgi:hypothetical protein
MSEFGVIRDPDELTAGEVRRKEVSLPNRSYRDGAGEETG